MQCPFMEPPSYAFYRLTWPTTSLYAIKASSIANCKLSGDIIHAVLTERVTNRAPKDERLLRCIEVQHRPKCRTYAVF